MCKRVSIALERIMSLNSNMQKSNVHYSAIRMTHYLSGPSVLSLESKVTEPNWVGFNFDENRVSENFSY